MNIEGLEEKDKISKLNSRLEALKGLRSDWEQDWRDAAKYFHPKREFLTDLDKPSASVGKERYDDFPVHCNDMHANGMQGNLIGSSIKWFQLAFRIKDFESIPFAKDWLEACEEVMYSSFHTSGFYSQLTEFLKDGGALGTACMYTEWNPEKESVIFRTINPGQIYLAEDYSGDVDTLYREFTMTASQLQGQFKDSISEEAMKSLKDNEPDQEFTIVHAVFPRRKRDKNKQDNSSMPFYSIYYQKGEEHILRESGYTEFPFLVWRYDKNDDEQYGRGPGLKYLPTAKRINKFARGKMKIADLAADPPFMEQGNMKGRVKYTPGGRTVVNSLDSPPIKMDVAGDYPVSKDEIDGLRQDLKQAFLVDYFLMLNQAERQMTAYEVSEKQGEKATILGSVVGRLNQELVHPLIVREFGHLFRAGKLPAPPMELLQMGFKLDVHMMGPLAMSQKHYAKSQGINRGLQSLMQVAQVFPEVVDTVDGDILTREVLDASGMPQKAIREIYQIQELREQRAQQAQAKQQMAMAAQMADMAPKLNEKVVPGSSLEAINDQLQAAGGAGQ